MSNSDDATDAAAPAAVRDSAAAATLAAPGSSEQSSGDAAATKDTAATAGAKDVSASAGASESATKGKDGGEAKSPSAKKRGRKPSRENVRDDVEGDDSAKAPSDASKPETETSLPPKKRGRVDKDGEEEAASTDAVTEPEAASGDAKTTASEPAPESAGDNAAAAVPAATDAAEKPKKRKAPSSKKLKKDAGATTAAAADDANEETESEPERQPKKRAKPAKAPREKKSPARKKKAAKEVVESETDSEDEREQELLKRVDALAPEVKAKFGSIVWAKMVGYPYWPALITDPRHLPAKFQATALKDVETKYLVYFYSTKNFAPTLFKNIEAWDDTKNDYRAGFPVKDSKAPKRREKLLEAIAEADKELLLPIDERVNGLLKPIVKAPKVARDDSAATDKRKARTPTSKAKSKSAKTPAERKSKKKSDDSSADAAAPAATAADANDTDEPSQESQEEEPPAPSLSKEEIKAKIASRKTPSKKKVSADESDAKAKASGASKKGASGASKAIGKLSADEIDTKRKKEIELVVPRKSVKSADIREMTEEAAKKKLPGASKDKAKQDKAAYTVGDLATFASKLTRYHANESAKNNDQVIQMLNQLFDEKVVYRSDVERSGLAAIIATLRKSSNPTVAQTASALRKHMINIIKHDTDGSAESAAKASAKAAASETAGSKSASKKASAEGSKSGEKKSEAAQQSAPVAAATAATAPSSESKAAAEVKSPSSASSAGADKADVAGAESTKAESADAAAVDTKPEGVSDKTVDSPKDTSAASGSTAATTPAEPAAPASASSPRDDGMKADASLDANRKAFVVMLSNVLEASGTSNAKLANEIEEHVFDRYKESNDDYMKHARKITFGLRGNKALLDRLVSGSLHGLELAYADDKFFEAS